MNIQQTEIPKDVAALAAENERAATAARQQEEKARPAAQDHDAQDKAGHGSTLNRQDAEKLLKKAEDYFGHKGVNLHFKALDGESGEVQVEVQDAQSKKVILKIPQDELVKLSENIKRMAKGVMDKAV
jgi:uncharacterized FlaG/YvyC family protein